MEILTEKGEGEDFRLSCKWNKRNRCFYRTPNLKVTFGSF